MILKGIIPCSTRAHVRINYEKTKERFALEIYVQLEDISPSFLTRVIKF